MIAQILALTLAIELSLGFAHLVMRSGDRWLADYELRKNNV